MSHPFIDRFRAHQGDDQLDLFPETRQSSRFWRWLPLLVIVAIVVLLAASANAQEHQHSNHGDLLGFRSAEQHAEWHGIYKTLHNQQNTHCCDNGDCRPTMAKYENGQWSALVDGQWRIMVPSRFVQEYAYSWSETAHVCAAPPTNGNEAYVFCFVPPGAQG